MQLQWPGKQNWVTSLQSLCSHKHTPTCCEQMSAWLTCTTEKLSAMMLHYVSIMSASIVSSVTRSAYRKTICSTSGAQQQPTCIQKAQDLHQICVLCTVKNGSM
jgi:hypothetical protein